MIVPAPPSGRLPEATRSAGGASRQQGVLGTREIHFHLLSETPSYITDCYYNYIKICATDSGIMQSITIFLVMIRSQHQEATNMSYKHG